jgi:hypothetical protein
MLASGTLYSPVPNENGTSSPRKDSLYSGLMKISTEPFSFDALRHGFNSDLFHHVALVIE